MGPAISLQLRLLLLLVALAALGCAGVSKPSIRVGTPELDERERSVAASAASSGQLHFKRPVLWTNGPRDLATAAVSLPAGIYTLEGEDASYRYFRAPATISLRRIQGGEVAGGEDGPGGVALAKAPFNPLQAVVYVDSRPGFKQHALWLGDSFLELEGRDWTRSD